MTSEIPVHLQARASLSELVESRVATIASEAVGAEKHARVPFFAADPIDKAYAQYGGWFTRADKRAYVSQPVRVFRLPAAVLLGADGVVLHDGAAVRDTVRHLSTWAPDTVVAEFVHHTSLRLKQAIPLRDGADGAAFVGFNGAWRNHAHWIQECLPKLLVWQRLREQLGRPRLAVPRTRPGSVVAETLRLLGIGEADIIAVEPGEALAFGETFVVGETELFDIPSLMAEAATALASAVPAAAGARTLRGERIYIHRTVEARRVANFSAVCSVLERYGFSVVSFEDVPLAEQIAIMRSARYVIGEHGAGLINITFCQPGAAVLELFNPACPQPAFWSVASACGHRYGFVVGTHVPDGLRPASDWNAAYEIAPDRLEAAILAMLDEQPAAALPAAPEVPPERYGGEDPGDFRRGTMPASFGRSGSDEYLQLFDALTLPAQLALHREADLPAHIRGQHYAYLAPPAVRVHSVAQGVVWGNGLVTRSHRFFMPLGSYPPYMRPGAFNAEGHTLPWFWSGALDLPNAETVRLDDPAAVALHPNLGYGSMILEMLPKLYQLALLRTLGVRFRLCLTRELGAWVRGFIRLYFDDDEITWFDGAAARVVAPAVIVPPMLHVDHNYHPAMNLVVADALQRAGAPVKPERRRRLYVARVGDERRLENDLGAHAALADLGFELVRPEEMDPVAQLQLFAQAEMVVGEYGSPLLNAVFAPPGTRVVAVNCIDWYLSSIGRLRRHPIAYVPTQDGGFPDWRPDKLTGAMHRVDPALLRATVQEMLQQAAGRLAAAPAAGVRPPPGPHRKLVLSYCSNYGLAQVEAFIASVRAAVPDADLCFFAANMGEDFLRHAAQSGIAVLDATPYLDPAVHPLNSRFLMFRDMLQANAERYDFVMISDARDVIFQSDPFALLNGQAVNFAVEAVTLGQETLNASWMRERYGAAVHDEIRAHRVVCAGTTLGTTDGMRRYLAAMCTEIGAPGYDRRVNYDQASHNYIAWKLRPEWCVVDRDDRIVATVGCTSGERIAIDKDRVLVDGYAAPVVHQWDRHAKIADFVAGSAQFRVPPPDAGAADASSAAGAQ